jgi:hypothetical protein
VFRNQQPKAGQVPADPVCEELSHAALETGWIAKLLPNVIPTELRLNFLFWLCSRPGTALVEFFFEAHTRK